MAQIRLPSHQVGAGAHDANLAGAAGSDLWWSSLKPQFPNKQCKELDDSVYTAPEEATIDLDEYCERCYRKWCPCIHALSQCYHRLLHDRPPPSVVSSQYINVNWKNFLLAGFVSMMIATCLFCLSHFDRHWFITVGANRQIDSPSLFSREMTFTSSHIKFPKSQLLVYQIEGHCPPLALTPVVQTDSRKFTFGSADSGTKNIFYHYSYFYLNQGSTIDLELSQTRGSSNVFLLRGQNIIARVVNDVSQDSFGGFEKLALMKRSLTEGDTDTMQYTVEKADDYVIVYESVSHERGQLLTQYSVHATNYDVTALVSACTDPLGDCTIHLPLKKSCIIIQSQPDAVQSFGEAVMFLTVRAKNRVWLIVALSILPAIIAALLLLHNRVVRSQDSYEPIEDVILIENGNAHSTSLQSSAENSLSGMKYVDESFMPIA